MSPLWQALLLVGRQARWALPIGVLIGIAVPPLARWLAPLLTAAVIGTLTAAMLRLDWTKLAALARRPMLPAGLALMLLVVSPLAMWALAWLIGLPAVYALVLVLQAAAPPIGSTAAFALILNLDAGLCLIGTLLATILLPVTLTLIVALLLPGAGISVDPWLFFLRVCLVIAAPFVLAGAIRLAAGAERLRRNDEALAGINVVLLVVFAIAVMNGVTERWIAEPALMFKLLALAFAFTIALHGLGYLLFRAYGDVTAYSAALMSGNRNMGLMLAVTAGTAGPVFSLYVGIAQIPMYCAPLLLAPWVEASRRRHA